MFEIDRVTLFGLVASLAGMGLVLELVRRRKLREDYSLLWLLTSFSLILLTISRPLLDRFAAVLGIVTYPPAALFLVAIIFMLVILLHYATVLTRLGRENKQLAQQMAILRWELHETRQLTAVKTSEQQNRHQADAE